MDKLWAPAGSEVGTGKPRGPFSSGTAMTRPRGPFAPKANVEVAMERDDLRLQLARREKEQDDLRLQLLTREKELQSAYARLSSGQGEKDALQRQVGYASCNLCLLLLP